VKGDEGIKFENFVAISLLKHLQAIEDYQGIKTKLSYLRTKEKKEVDFVLEQDLQIEKIIEVKLSDSTLSKTLIYFSHKYNLSAIQLVKNLRNERVEKGIEVRKGFNYLKSLYL
jgi:predicted AAA+ superfamily ATPase